MGGFRKAGSWLGLVEGEDGDWYEDELPVEQNSPGSADAEPKSQIATIYPVTFQDARTVGSYFRQDIPVIMNLTGLDDSEAKRFVDFASGLILGRRGSLDRISQRVFLLRPDHVAAPSATDSDISTEGFYNQG